jgi:hypothetical protein
MDCVLRAASQSREHAKAEGTLARMMAADEHSTQATMGSEG